MVSIEELLKRVQQAETETERQWILLELQMSQMPDDLVSMLWAAAIPHFFDANILAALRPELAEQADKLYEKLKTLTFVEEFPKQGYNIHELTRNVLLNQLWQQDKDEFLRLSQRAADYFFSEKMSSEEGVEFCYHEILNEGEVQTGRLLDRVIDWWTYNQIERLQAAVQGFREHEIAYRLDNFGKGFSLHLQGIVKMRSGHYAEAESFLSRTETFYKEINLKNLRYITTLLRDIGSSKKEQGDYDSSVYFYENALSISEEQLGENHPHTATSLNNLAGLYENKGRYDEAESLYLRALKIYEEQLGENHPHTSTSLNNLAGLYKNKGRYDEAESLYLRALKIREEQLGETHPKTATSLNNLAGLYKNKGRYDEAESLYLRALKIREEQLGETHPKTANSLNNLAELYKSQKRNLEAIPLLERWKAIKRERQETQNKSYADRIWTLGKLYEKCQQFPQAVAAYEETLFLFNYLLAPNHPQILFLKAELARLKKNMKKVKK
jgi:tetratricopeptide (TPR) repeat protein